LLMLSCSHSVSVMSQFTSAAVTVSIAEQKTYAGQVFPLVLSPNAENAAQNINFWLDWAREHKAPIKDELLKYGAVLFRDFPIQSPQDFDAFVKVFGYKAFPYVGGAAPRTVVTGDVFTANEAPPSEKIPYHHEMAQVPNFPKVLFFSCEIAPSTGGQTTLVPSNVIYNEMLKRRPEFVKRLEQEGVRYIRIMPENDDPNSPIGRGWKSTYLTSNKEDVVKKAGAQGTELEWLENGNLKTTTKILPGVKEDPRTGKKTWFNSIIAAYLGWQDSRNDRTKAVVFANGDVMDPEDMRTLEEVFEENAMDFMWKKVRVRA
jgi:hypothetical protein